MRISVIIPTLNEADTLGLLLARLAAMDPGLELIVADGGSEDGTAAIAGGRARVVGGERGRGAQMNRGAAAAGGDVLWFLHADCEPDPRAADLIREALSDPGVVAGAFTFAFDGREPFFRIAEWTANLRNRLLGRFYGDMGIFLRRDTFESLGGYAEIPLMEDMEFCRRASRAGRIVILPTRIKTSVRRWRESGILRTTLKMWSLQVAWRLGVSPERLARHYPFGNGVRRQQDEAQQT